MKKNGIVRKGTKPFACFNRQRAKKTFMLLLIASIFQFNMLAEINGHSKLNIQLGKTTVGKVLETLKISTNLNVAFTHELVDVNRVVNANYTDISLNNILKDLFDETKVGYRIVNEQIILFEKTIAQDEKLKVSGVIKDEQGAPIPGVTVLEVGTENGGITDMNGRYTLTNVDPAAELKYSFVGMQTEMIAVNGRSVIDVVMNEDIISLNEVVTIGYGSQKKSDITGSVAVVDMKALPVKSPTSVSQVLQGVAAGVQVTNSGNPGSDPLIYIRGISSFGSTTPLYVIDGVPSCGNRDFNPNDVESIQVLKDASAASIYGSRAANGVILITTKKGKEKFAIDFDARYGIEQVSKKIDLMNASQYATLDNMAHDNAGIAHNPANDLVLSNPSKMPNTDWQGYMFQPGAIQDYNLSMSSSGEKSTYRTALGFLDREGVIRGPEFKRVAFSNNSTHDYGKLQMGTSIRMTYTNARDMIGNPFFDALTAIPNVAIYDANNIGGFGAGDDTNQTYFTNPVGAQLTNENRAHSYKFVANVFAEYAFTKSLKYKFNVGIDASNQRFIAKRKAAYLRYKDNPISSMTERTTHWLDWSFTHMLTFNKTFAKHNLNAVGVYSYEGHKERFASAFGEDVAKDGNGNYFWAIDATKKNQAVAGTSGEKGLHSMIGRINYSYDDKYLLQISGRYDYSSQFNKNNRVAFFPATSLGWKINKESFLADVDKITLLKLRVGYGELGGQNIGFYDYAGFINQNVNYVFGKDQHIVNGATQIKLANEDLIWETTVSKNVGIDFGLFKNSIQGSFEVYQTDTRDAILPIDIALSTGNYAGNPNQNIGEIRNTGIEFSLTYQQMDKEFKYRVNLNASSNKNEVLNVGNLGELAGNRSMTRVGHAISTFYLRETNGIFQIGEEEEAAKQNARPGDVRYVDQPTVDLNGDGILEPDGIIDDNDRVLMGNPFPKADIGLNLYAEYKGFDASVFLHSQLGHDIFWGQGEVMDRTDDYVNKLANYTPWTPENKSNTTPIAMYGAAGSRNYYHSQDRYLYNGDFLKVKNVEIGYTLPSTVLNKIGMRKLRIYFSAQNLFTFTKYPGFDPEVVNGWILERGVDWGAYPSPRTISLGLQAKF